MLTLKQLKCLVAVSETRHFRRAAEICGLTQPSLSAQIQNLEAELGVQLVERSRSGVAMTPVGREAVEQARLVIDATDGILALADSARTGLAGTIRLGTTPTLGPYFLPHLVATLHRQHRDLRLYVRESTPADLEYELAKGVHDVIFTQVPARSGDVVTYEIFREPLLLAYAPDHPLAKVERLTPAALRDVDILSLSSAYRMHDQVNALCETFGARLVRDYEGTSLDALRQMAGMGMGAAFLPALYADSEIRARSEVEVRPLSGRSIARTIGLVWRKSAGRAPAYRRLAEITRDIASKRFKDLLTLS